MHNCYKEALSEMNVQLLTKMRPSSKFREQGVNAQKLYAPLTAMLIAHV